MQDAEHESVAKLHLYGPCRHSNGNSAFS